MIEPGTQTCGDCFDGHEPECPLAFAADLGDCLAGASCKGCCPNGCKPRGLPEAAQEAGQRLRRMLGG